MPKNSKDTYQRIKKLFNSPPTPNQKAWGLINDFYHIILTVMEEKNISRTKLAERLGTSKAAVSKMLNNSPNITVRKMVNLTEAVGVDIGISLNHHEPVSRHFDLKSFFTENELDKFCKKHNIKTMSLFGSAVKDDLKAESDIDILVEFKEGCRPGFIKFISIQQELSDKIGRKVDLRTKYDLSERFRDEVVAEAEEQYVSGR